MVFVRSIRTRYNHSFLHLKRTNDVVRRNVTRWGWRSGVDHVHPSVALAARGFSQPNQIGCMTRNHVVQELDERFVRLKSRRGNWLGTIAETRTHADNSLGCQPRFESVVVRDE